MTTPEGNEDKALGDAIRLRMYVHRALDRDDIESVIESNHLADAAYLRLNPCQARAYMEWIKSVVDFEQVKKDFVQALGELFSGDGDA